MREREGGGRKERGGGGLWVREAGIFYEEVTLQRRCKLSGNSNTFSLSLSLHYII